MTRVFGLLALLGLAACSPPTPEQAADRCEERARAAQGPEVGVTVGANSNDGPFFGGSISISADAIRGRDPAAVYEECVFNLTGEPPVRSVRLRS
ncbi:MAG: hypothetical protein AAFU41_20390 [Pseudomonadota bacterium]